MNCGSNTAHPNQEQAGPTAPVLSEFCVARDAFLLDIDGTLLDIAATPEAVHVPAMLKSSLAILQRATGGALALVSGRPLSGIDELFAPLAFSAIGCHGAEWRKKPGENIAFRALRLAPEIRDALLGAIAGLPEIRVEDKGYTLAFHYRGAPQHKSLLEKHLSAQIAAHAELCLLHGKSVLEVKACAFNKGEAVAALMNWEPFANRRPVFVGDDHTDDDAFAVVRKMGGVGISVGRRSPLANRMLPAPYAMRSWLAHLAGTMK